MSFTSYFVTFLLGGVVLPPLLLVALICAFYAILPRYVEEEDKQEEERTKELDDISEFSTNDDNEYQRLKLTEIEEKNSTGVKAFKAGWITVTREYHTFASNAADKPIEPKESKSAYTTLYRLVKKKTTGNGSTQQTETPTVEVHPQSITAQADPKASSRRKNRYYGILRHGNLFLYKDETLKNVQHVIVLSNHLVTLWPRDLLDGELFTKRSAICILKKTPRRKSDAPPKTSSASLEEISTNAEATVDVLEKGVPPNPNTGFFIYCDYNYDKEDWYFELIKATKRENIAPTGTELDKLEPSIYADTLHFKTADMISLIQTLHSSEGQLYTRWFNALLGRIFLAVQGTEYFEKVVRDRLVKKLSKINRPGFLDEFRIKKIDVGEAAPVISFPKLQELNPDGSLRIGVRFSYKGKISIQIATTANINLGSHFKTREVNILLALTVNKIEGPLAIKIKAPPSSRLWYTFEKNPDIDFTIEPVVSQRQITYSMITKAIESRLKNAINDSLVEPAWDDVSFFHSEGEVYRGGIWDTKQRPEEKQSDENGVDEEEEEEEEEDIVGDESQDEFNPDDIEEVQSKFTTKATGDDISAAAQGVTTSCATSANIVSDDDGTSSIRSKFSNKFSQKSTINIKSRKTEPVIETSTEQFLSNGDYVLKENQAVIDPVDSADGASLRSNDDSGLAKRTLSSSIRKIGRWYNEKTNSIKSPPPSRDSKEYRAPEMIQSRRRPSSVVSGGSYEQRTLSSSSTTAVQPVSPSYQKTAPQAHSFPVEYLYGLDNPNPDAEHETKITPPSKIADMKSPYDMNRSSTIVAPTTVQTDNTTMEEEEDPVIAVPHMKKIPDRKKPPSLATKKSVELLEEIRKRDEAASLNSTAEIKVQETFAVVETIPKAKDPENDNDGDSILDNTTTKDTVPPPPPLPPRGTASMDDAIVENEEIQEASLEEIKEHHEENLVDLDD